MSKPFCRKCLLAETDLTGVYASVREMVAALPEWRKTSEAEYNRRLGICKSCDFLGEGTCEKCGCYVDLRAARSEMHCPHENHFW
ncbi:MAG: hypothetical protein HFJ89_06815 [Oscillospiraceae bacterium]|jgi:hypothetical protein|nr:hypothetical protein [Oscillospiraceae bacterium]